MRRSMLANEDNPLEAVIRKLGRLRPLDEPERQGIYSLPFRTERVSTNHHLVREGDRVTECSLLLAGYAFRYKLTRGGTRQIVSFHMPGDILDVQHLMLERADHSVMTNSAA